MLASKKFPHSPVCLVGIITVYCSHIQVFQTPDRKVWNGSFLFPAHNELIYQDMYEYECMRRLLDVGLLRHVILLTPDPAAHVSVYDMTLQ